MKKIVFSSIFFLCLFVPFLTIAAELGIYKPYGSCVDGTGCLFTANPFKSEIHKFDSTGNVVWTYGVYGSSVGQFRTPQGIALDSTGNLYVTDTCNHRIVKLIQSPSGPVWDSVILGDPLYLPRDIFIDQNDNLFIVDANNRVLKCDISGNPVLSFLGGTSNIFGVLGNGPGRFNDPYGIFVDKEGFIYVADSGNNRIQKFSPDGSFLLSIGSEGTEPGNFLQPHDVVVTSGNRILVADSLNFRIQEFDSSGIFLSSSIDPKWKLGKTINVQTLSIGPSDFLYVPSASTSISNPVVVDADTNPPVISIAGVENGVYYNYPISPVINIVEPHPEVEYILLNGLSYTGGTIINTEGKYTLEVYAKDRAGNEASLSISFIIDFTPPVINLTGVSNGEKYDSDVAMRFSVFDNLDPAPSVVSNYPSGALFTNSGKYTVEISAKDKAGNNSQVSAVFEIYKLSNLIIDIKMSNIDEGIKKSLQAKLSKVQESLEKGRYNTAVNKLNSFINEVKAQRGKKIPEALADTWIDFAKNLISLISDSWGNLSLGELFINPGHPELSVYDEQAYDTFFDRIDTSGIKAIIVKVYIPEGYSSGRLYIQQKSPFSGTHTVGSGEAGSGEVVFDTDTSFDLKAIIERAEEKKISVLAGVSCFKTKQGEILDPGDLSHQEHIKSIIRYLLENYKHLDGIVLTDCSYGSTFPAGILGVEVLTKFVSEVKATMPNHEESSLGALLESSDNDINYKNNVDIFGEDYYKLSSYLDMIYVKTFQNQDENCDGRADHLPSWVGNSITYLSKHLNPLSGNPEKSTCLVPLVQTFDILEPWEDLNLNGSYDDGEPYTDMNKNGIHDVYITTTAEDISTVISGIRLKVSEEVVNRDEDDDKHISDHDEFEDDKEDRDKCKPDISRTGIGICADEHTKENEWLTILHSHIH